MEFLIVLVVVVALVFGVKRYLTSTKKPPVTGGGPVDVPTDAVFPDIVTIPAEPIQLQAASVEAPVVEKSAVKKAKVAKKSAKAPAKTAKPKKPKKPKMTVVK